MITEKQKKERKLGIGGSDMPIILELSSYKTAYQLYLEKKLIIESSHDETPIQYWGNVLESVIRAEFSRRNNVVVEEPTETFIHPFYNFMRGHIDGWIPEWNAVFEAKNSNQFMAHLWGKSQSDVIPIEYLVQVAFYCSVLNSPCAYISVLIGGNDYREFKYTRDLELEETIIHAATKFWDSVQNDNPPTPINHNDIKLKYPFHDPAKSKSVDSFINDKLCDIKSVRLKMKELKEIEDKSKLTIMEYMEDAECLVDECGRALVTWKSNKNNSRQFLIKD